MKNSRKLVIEYYAKQEQNLVIPKQYSQSKSNWHCDVIIKYKDYTDTFEINAKKKVYLLEIFEAAQETLKETETDGAIDCGFKIYRCG